MSSAIANLEIYPPEKSTYIDKTHFSNPASTTMSVLAR